MFTCAEAAKVLDRSRHDLAGQGHLNSADKVALDFNVEKHLHVARAAGPGRSDNNVLGGYLWHAAVCGSEISHSD